MNHTFFMRSTTLPILFLLFFLIEINAKQQRLDLIQVNEIGREVSEKQELFFSGIRMIKSNKNGSKIFVADVSDNTIRIYNSDGGFLFKIGRRGRGPGEFQQVTSFEILDNEVVVILDRFLNRISYFDSIGSLKETVPIRNQVPVGSSLLLFEREFDKNHFIAYRDFRKNGNDFLLHHFDINFKTKENQFINVFKYFYDLNNPMEVQISQRPAYLGTRFGDDKIAFVADTYTGTLAMFDKKTLKETLVGKPIKDYVKNYAWDLRKKYRATGETGFASSSNQQGKFFL